MCIRDRYPGDVHAVKDMDMEIKRGEFIVFVGPSGCGKTTLLRMIAGPVSYTHLDVYKRQYWKRPGNIFQGQGAQGKRLKEFRAGPVFISTSKCKIFKCNGKDSKL